MSCASEYIPQLRKLGFRVTPQRMAILHVLHHSGTHLSPSEVFVQARRNLPRITEPTVYRTLEFLAENGFAQTAYTRNGHSSYQIAGAVHHHILCRICGRETEVQHHLLDGLYRKLESTSGYQRINSHMTFFGVCPKCQKRHSEKGG